MSEGLAALAGSPCPSWDSLGYTRRNLGSDPFPLLVSPEFETVNYGFLPITRDGIEL